MWTSPAGNGQKMKWLKRHTAQLVLFFALCLTAGAGPAQCLVADPALEQLQQDLNAAVAAARPSVVSIRAEKSIQSSGKGPPLLYESIGSGFLVDERGYVLTNHHVVENSRSIAVTLWRAQGNSPISAHIVDIDSSLDLALLKLDTGERFIPARLGNSDRLKMGDWVLSMGSPFGFEHTVTLGIVSDRHRDLLINGVPYNGMIQTDAVINQGNSGGPLLDVYGRVVGIGTAIYAPDGTSTGVAFAIPVNRAKHFFTRTTGVMVAAATAGVNAPGPGAKEAINLNDRMPGDAKHQKFTDCTQCHSITTKSVVNVQKPMPHPMVGSCDICHQMVNEPMAQGPTPVAALIPKTGPRDQARSFLGFSRVVVVGTAAALALSALFCFIASQRDRKLPLLSQSSLLRFLFAFVVSMAGLFTVIGVFFG